MKLSDEKTVEHLIAVYKDDGGIYAKKMFGCYCVYFDMVPVGWVSDGIFWLKNVGRNDLYTEDYLREKKHLRQIPVFIEQFHLPWFKEIVSKTAMVVKQKQK